MGPKMFHDLELLHDLEDFIDTSSWLMAMIDDPEPDFVINLAYVKCRYYDVELKKLQAYRGIR